jgi:hypothetical protein
MNSQWMKRLGAARVWMTVAALSIVGVIWLVKR